MKTLILAIALVACPIVCGGELPLVVEHFDALIVLDDGTNQVVVFARNGQVMARRAVLDEMRWFAQGSVYGVEFQDYWTAERICTADAFAVFHVDSFFNENGPWWCQFRNMRDLKQP